MTLVDTILAESHFIEDGRSKYYVLSKIGEEFGELSVEVAIANGDSYKQPGKDGVIGESIDLIISALDLIYLENPNITEEELVQIALPKLAKWRAKVQAHRMGFGTTSHTL